MYSAHIYVYSCKIYVVLYMVYKSSSLIYFHLLHLHLQILYFCFWFARCLEDGVVCVFFKQYVNIQNVSYLAYILTFIILRGILLYLVLVITPFSDLGYYVRRGTARLVGWLHARPRSRDMSRASRKSLIEPEPPCTL